LLFFPENKGLWGEVKMDCEGVWIGIGLFMRESVEGGGVKDGGLARKNAPVERF
jgi:hypothetical protein